MLPPHAQVQVEEHLGRRKSEGALALAEARALPGQLEAWQGILREAREQLLRAKRSIATLSEAPKRSIAFVDEALAIRSKALLGAAPRVFAETEPLRICASLSPDSIRAALADTGDLSHWTAFVCEGDPRREELARELGFENLQRISKDESTSIFSPASLQLAALRGADLSPAIDRASAALDGLHPNDSAQPLDPFHLGALLDGLAKRGAHNLHVAGPAGLNPFFAWLESASSQRSESARFSIFAGEPLEAPEACPQDRWYTNYRIATAAGAGERDFAKTQAATPSASAAHDPASRARRLIGAGVPIVQFELPSLDALAGELIRWELALSFAANAKAEARIAIEISTSKIDPQISNASLQEGPLAIHADGTHAYILGKVAGTLGKAATTSIHHWIAAQLAMGEGGDFVSLHWLPLAGTARRSELRELRSLLRGPYRMAVRESFSLPPLASHEGNPAAAFAATGARGLYFLLSDGGQSELLLKPGSSLSLRTIAREAEERTVAALAAAGRRTMLLRAEDGDASQLIAALRAAGDLLATR